MVGAKVSVVSVLLFLQHGVLTVSQNATNASNASNASTSTAAMTTTTTMAVTTTPAPATTTTMMANTTTTAMNTTTTTVAAVDVTTTTIAVVDGTTTTTVTDAPVATISFGFTISGVNVDDLTANPTVKASFELKCRENAASTAGDGIDAAHVTVTLSAGSVAVAAVISVPAGITLSADTINSNIATAVSSGSFATALVADLETISGISSIVSGTMGAVATAPTMLTATTTTYTTTTTIAGGSSGSGSSDSTDDAVSAKVSFAVLVVATSALGFIW